MILRQLIQRIKDTCPFFENRVFGSAQLAEGLRQAENMPVPSAFVMVDGDFPDGDAAQAGVIQQTQERWTIVVAVSNKDDMRGQLAGDQMHTVRKQLLKSLLNWENFQDVDETEAQDVDNDWGKVVYRGSLHIDMSAARLWHQFSFGHNIVLSAGTDYPDDPLLVPPGPGDDPEEGFQGPAMRGGPEGFNDGEHFVDAENKLVPLSELPAFKRPQSAFGTQPVWPGRKTDASE